VAGVAAAAKKGRGEEHAWLPSGQSPFAGKYTVERVLGQGGMGVVFEARHIRLGQRVAIKVLGSALREYPELVARFDREARAAGALTSVHAVRIFDIDATEDGTPFIVMELLAGRDLADILESEGPLPIGRAVRWILQACDAIAEAHSLGIIHRDIKPSNLFLTKQDGRDVVKVLDFGIAKRVAAQEAAITTAVAPLGTPQYMSPEQVRCAKDVDVRTDVWSLGVTLYELVAGRTPFAHESASACIASIAADPVPDPRTLRPDLGGDFVEVLMRALEKNPADRHPTVEELVRALTPFAEPEQTAESTSGIRRASTYGLPPATRDQATLDALPLLGADEDEDATESPNATTSIPPRAESAENVDSRGESIESHVEPAARPLPAVLDVAARAPLESRSDRTVPPAISLASVPAKRRLRSRFAAVGAAAIGLVALVMTPRFVAEHADGPVHAGANAEQAQPADPTPKLVETVAAAEPTAASPSALPTAAAEAKAADESEKTEKPAAAAPKPMLAVRPAAPVPPPAAVTSAAPSLTASIATAVPTLPASSQPLVGDPGKRVRPATDKTDKAKPQVATRGASGVHGGLSNPGF